MPRTRRPSLWSRTVPRKSSTAPSAGEPTSASSAAASIGSAVMRRATSTSGHGRQQCQLVAVGERLVEAGVLAIHGHDRPCGNAREAAAEVARRRDRIRSGSAGPELDVQLVAAGEVAIEGEEEESNAHAPC